MHGIYGSRKSKLLFPLQDKYSRYKIARKIVLTCNLKNLVRENLIPQVHRIVMNNISIKPFIYKYFDFH